MKFLYFLTVILLFESIIIEIKNKVLINSIKGCIQLKKSETSTKKERALALTKLIAMSIYEVTLLAVFITFIVLIAV